MYDASRFGRRAGGPPERRDLNSRELPDPFPVPPAADGKKLETRVEDILRVLIKKKDLDIAEKDKEAQGLRAELGSARSEADSLRGELQAAMAERDELARRVALLRLTSHPTSISRLDLAKADEKNAIREVLQELKEARSSSSRAASEQALGTTTPSSPPGTPVSGQPAPPAAPPGGDLAQAS
eukprot:tig00020562_g11162.t1